MICPTTEELAALYDGKLRLFRARPLRLHLARCPRCAAELETLHKIFQELDFSQKPKEALLIDAIQRQGRRLDPKPKKRSKCMPLRNSQKHC